MSRVSKLVVSRSMIASAARPAPPLSSSMVAVRPDEKRIDERGWFVGRRASRDALRSSALSAEDDDEEEERRRPIARVCMVKVTARHWMVPGRRGGGDEGGG